MRYNVNVSVHPALPLAAIAVLAVLKLTGVIALSWLWVFLIPILGTVALMLVLLVILTVVALMR